MSAEDYARYPAFIVMREVEVNGRILVTTLHNPHWVSARALDALYKMRWSIEVDFRTIKSTLQMDVLRCKSQSMIEKEIAVCLLAYNLVRWTMAKAASLLDVLPRALSFSGVKRLLNAFADQLRRTPSDQISTLRSYLRASPHCNYRIALAGSSRVQRNGDPKIFHCSPCRVVLRVSTSKGSGSLTE